MKKSLLSATLGLAALGFCAQTASALPANADALIADANNPTKWTAAVGNPGTFWALDPCIESYITNGTEGNIINFAGDLANGDYIVTFFASAHYANWGGTTSAASNNGAASFDGNKTFSSVTINGVETPVAFFTDKVLNAKDEIYIVPVTVTDGKLHISIDNKAAAANWLTFKMLHISDLTPTDVIFSQDFETGAQGNHLLGNKAAGEGAYFWELNFSNTSNFQNRQIIKNADAISGASFENWNGGGGETNMAFNLNVPNRKYKCELEIKANGAHQSLYFYAGDKGNRVAIENGTKVYALEAEVNNGVLEFGVNAESGCNVEWIVIDNAKVRVVEQITVATAMTALEAPAYAHVTGSERTALQNAVASADLNAIQEAFNAFTDAAPSYNAFATKKAEGAAYLAANPNASEEKVNALKVLVEFAPNTAAEAAAKATQFEAPIKDIVVSHAIAEGIASRTDYTSAITNPKANVSGWTSVAIGDNRLQEVATNKGEGTEWWNDYFDVCFWNGAWAVNFYQPVSLAPGKYRVSAFLRAQENVQLKFAAAPGASLPTDGSATTVVCTPTGSQGGLFGRGWQQYWLDVELTEGQNQLAIGFQAVAPAAQQWAGANDFKIVKIGDYTTGIETVEANGVAEYFDLNGRPVAAENLAHGIYILRQGGKVSKVIR